MMLVKILGFGTNWWHRFGRHPRDPYRYTRHAAYFNSAGVQCGRRVRRYWIVPGLIRFNGVVHFNPHFPNRSVGGTFECVDRPLTCGGNGMLLLRRSALNVPPDYYLVAVSAANHGLFNFAEFGWRSDGVNPIAVSCLGEKQEAIVLMKPLSYVRSSLGVWQLRVEPNERYGASLELLEEER